MTISSTPYKAVTSFIPTKNFLIEYIPIMFRRGLSVHIHDGYTVLATFASAVAVNCVEGRWTKGYRYRPSDNYKWYTLLKVDDDWLYSVAEWLASSNHIWMASDRLDAQYLEATRYYHRGVRQLSKLRHASDSDCKPTCRYIHCTWVSCLLSCSMLKCVLAGVLRLLLAT